MTLNVQISCFFFFKIYIKYYIYLDILLHNFIQIFNEKIQIIILQAIAHKGTVYIMFLFNIHTSL
jgi:hypothetical protein